MVVLSAVNQNQHVDTAYIIGLNCVTRHASYNLVMKGKNEVFEFRGEELWRRRVGGNLVAVAATHYIAKSTQLHMQCCHLLTTLYNNITLQVVVSGTMLK